MAEVQTDRPHLIDELDSGSVLADFADRNHAHRFTDQELHVVEDDMQLAVVAGVEKCYRTALLASQKFIAEKTHEDPRADATGADDDLVRQGMLLIVFGRPPQRSVGSHRASASNMSSVMLRISSSERSELVSRSIAIAA